MRASSVDGARRSAHTPLCSADHVLAFCEEAHKRRMLREGKPYTGKLPVRADAEINPMPAGRAALWLVCTLLPLLCFSTLLLDAGCPLSIAHAPSQSPIPIDRHPGNKLKAPRMVKWKMDRLF